MNKRYLLVFTFPSGTKYAATVAKNRFAFTPITSDGKVNGAMSWDFPEEAMGFLKRLLEQMSEEQRKSLASLKPQVVPLSNYECL